MEAELVARLQAAKNKRTLAMKEPDVAKLPDAGQVLLAYFNQYDDS